jgi:stage II sporulation protein D
LLANASTLFLSNPMKASSKFLPLLIIFVFFCFNAYACLPGAHQSLKHSHKTVKNTTAVAIPETGGLIRVLLASSSESITYRTTTDCKIYEGEDKVYAVDKNTTITVRLLGKEIRLTADDKQYTGAQFSVAPSQDDELLQYGSKKYRGNITFLPAKNQIYVVNALQLESYLCGVLPAELGNSQTKDIDAAIEAFAIVARTFAVQKSAAKNKFYDIEGTTNAQVYGGAGIEKQVFNDAISHTSGKILMYQGGVAQLFYSACCGGVTEDASNVFNKQEIPYLTSHPDGDPANCATSPVFEWKEEYTAKQFKQYLSKQSDASKEITDVKVTKTLPSGRVSELTIEFEDGTAQVIAGKNIRQTIRRAANGAILKSSLFEVDIKKSDGFVTRIILNGKGNGHGVGLCQWGAMSLAKQGRSAEDILEFYFPGTQIKEIDD